MKCLKRKHLYLHLEQDTKAISEINKAELEKHIQSCPRCRDMVDKAKTNAAFAQKLFTRSEPTGLSNAEIDRSFAFFKENTMNFDQRSSRMAIPNNFSPRKGFSSFFLSSKVGQVASSLAALIVVIGVFSSQPVQTMASELLNVFRVENFKVLTLSPEDIATLSKLDDPGDVGAFNMTGGGYTGVETIAEAEKKVGFEVRSPDLSGTAFNNYAKPQIMVTERAVYTLVLDLEKVNKYLRAIGADNVNLPKALDGKKITGTMPDHVIFEYHAKARSDGDSFVPRDDTGQPIPSPDAPAFYVGQAMGPEIVFPEGVDLLDVRSELLKIPLLPPEVKNQLESLTDWRKTIFIPIPEDEASAKDVMVEGSPGVLITHKNSDDKALIWKTGSIINFIGATQTNGIRITEKDMLIIAGTMQ